MLAAPPQLGSGNPGRRKDHEQTDTYRHHNHRCRNRRPPAECCENEQDCRDRHAVSVKSKLPEHTLLEWEHQFSRAAIARSNALILTHVLESIFPGVAVNPCGPLNLAVFTELRGPLPFKSHFPPT